MHPTAALNPSPVTVHDVSERLRARSRAVGVLVMSGFGAVWASAGIVLSSGPSWAWIVVVSWTVAFGAHAIRLLRANARVDTPLPADIAELRRRAGRIFLWTSVAEGLGIFLAVNVVVNLGHPQWQAAAIMLVVGLHFLPLALAFAYRPHAVTGIAMSAWALGFPWVFAAGALAPAGLFGAAAILFASAAYALRSTGRHAR